MDKKELMKMARGLFGVSGFSEDFFKKFDIKREQTKTQAEARQRVAEYKKRGYVATYKRFDFVDLARESIYEVVAIREKV